METETEPAYWTAILCPVGMTGRNGQVKRPGEDLSWRLDAPLTSDSGERIGTVDSVTEFLGYVYAQGPLDVEAPTGIPVPTIKSVGTTDVIESVTIADTPNWEDRFVGFIVEWCVNLRWTHELIPMPSRERALQAVARHNASMGELNRGDGDLLDGFLVDGFLDADVCRWPYEPGDVARHAKSLASLALHDPRGWLS